MTAYYRNEMLFSEIYLEEITRQPEHADVLASLKVLREYRDYADTSNLIAWKKTYVHEVLAALGFNATVKDAGLTLLYPMGSVEQPVSICFVTLPNESLDNTHMGRNWAEKTIRALRQQGLQWGLLTNGKQWRIYHLDESTPYETYLEIDVESILGDQAKEAYQIFHKFMKAGNFAVEDAGKCQFDRFKKESKDKIDYIQKELANALRQREEGGKGVLSDLCMGLVEELRTSPQPSPTGEGVDLDDESLRRKIYHGAMLYMFRLLFLFYADARGLLSDENHALLAEVDADTRSLHNGETGGGRLWNRLSAIFVDIDQTYNGGLFSPQESEFTRFIEETHNADRYLAETLFNLITYHEKNGQERPISYRDMGVRHLGTLYEGLLEHKLFITKEDTEVRATKGKIEFIPISRGGKAVRGQTLPAGAVYFGSDPSERKSTGSYFTPEYIVDYIVRNTVGKKLEELKADFMAQEKANLEALKHAVDEAERAALAKLLEENIRMFVREKILALSVLDPAMGSGHFLVNVANLIANFITEFLNELGIEGETPTGTAYWRRWVVENCIYGVDLNPLAVELAKLSLWILSMAKDQPLSFMNHHLKCGNSLVGARLDEIGNYPFSTAKKEPRQMNMFARDPNFRAAVEDAIAKSQLIASHASTTLEDVEEKKAWLAEIEEDLKGYKAICNVHTGMYFGDLVDENEYTRLIEKREFSQAFVMEKPNQYFHWELEFPEVFLDLQLKHRVDESGFDLVIGNPPYIPTEQMSQFDRVFFSQKYPVASGKYDLSVVFLGRCANLLATDGQIGMIVPTTWETGDNYLPFRKNYFASKVLSPSFVVNLPFDVFPGAYIDTCIAIFQKSLKDVFFVFAYPKKEEIEWINLDDRLIGVQRKLVSEDKTNRIFMSAGQYSFLEKFKKLMSISLAEITDSCQGPVESFYEYCQKPELDGDLPYYSCDVDRYDMDIVEKRFIKFGAQNSLTRFYTQPRVLIRRIVSRDNRLMATYTKETFVVRKDLNPFILKDKSYNILYVLAIINSTLLSHIFTRASATAGKDDFRQTTLGSLGSLPIRSIKFVTIQENRIKELSRVNQLYTTNKIDELIALTRTWLKRAPKQTDFVHDLLVFLTEQMIEMNLSRQYEIKRFMNWLMGEIGIDIKVLSGKTIIQNYLGDYQKDQQQASFEEILAVLCKNQKNLQMDVSDVAFLNRLDSEYQSSLQKLIPLKERLAATDRLIDQIVYQLYGLTEEEIAIVEAKG